MQYNYKIPASSDDLVLAVSVIKNDIVPTGILQMVHGMCEHKERYYRFMEYMAGQGFVCVIHDHRGHGESVKSNDDLGYMYAGGGEALVVDIRVVNEWIRSQYPDLKCVLFGHSMGSLAVRCFAKKYDSLIDALFVCGSPSHNPLTPVAKCIAKTLGLIFGDHHRSELIQKLAFMGYNKGFEDEGYSRAWVCSNHEVLEKYHHDPLCRFTFTTNSFTGLFDLMINCYSKKNWKVSNADLPIYFISGHNDPCRTSDKAFQHAVNTMRTVGYNNVKSRLFENMRHELLNEIDAESVWSFVLKKINEL